MKNTKTAAQETVDQSIAAFNESDFARLLGMTVTDARDGYSEVVMDCTGKKNPHGVAHGGAIFALADQAFGIAANCAGADRVAVSVHIQFIAPATGAMVARATRIADNGKYSTFRILVSEGDRLIAEFEGVALQVRPPC
ncbi:hotdog fold thioesterase [uncultured Methanoregula sp.]|uniref:PaaI family thioesterase n=1 Tax=uncultured Methanoregula sp. TaxID=1005933 RepID=UPI002AAC047B|nr:hotdog fold thioesterase [uncultured Methanoregula sp.]